MITLRHALPALLLLTWVNLVQAASFTANSSLDLPDNNPGDGLCRSDGLPASSCTLRAAIMEANALPGSHIINLQSGRTYTLTRTGVDDTALNGDLDITKSLIVWCLGCEQRAVLDVNGIGRGIHVLGGDVTLAEFDITGANALLPGELAGGAVFVGSTAGTVVLSQMRLYGNTATQAGALLNFGPATTLSTSEVFDNFATNSAATAIFNVNFLTIRRSVVHGNDGDSNTGRAAVMTIETAGNPGRLVLENATIGDNVGLGLRIVNSAIVEIFSSTLAGNSDRGLRVEGVQPAVSVRNTLIARNGGGDCLFAETDGAFVGSSNLFSDASCEKITGIASVQNTDPLLTPLKVRGGTVRMPLYWPRIGSPALSAASTLPIGDPKGCRAIDQIGISRPQSFNGTSRCDIGAAEVPADALFFDSMETL